MHTNIGRRRDTKAWHTADGKEEFSLLLFLFSGWLPCHAMYLERGQAPSANEGWRWRWRWRWKNRGWRGWEKGGNRGEEEDETSERTARVCPSRRKTRRWNIGNLCIMYYSSGHKSQWSDSRASFIGSDLFIRLGCGVWIGALVNIKQNRSIHRVGEIVTVAGVGGQGLPNISRIATQW